MELKWSFDTTKGARTIDEIQTLSKKGARQHFGCVRALLEKLHLKHACFMHVSCMFQQISCMLHHACFMHVPHTMCMHVSCSMHETCMEHVRNWDVFHACDMHGSCMSHDMHEPCMLC